MLLSPSGCPFFPSPSMRSTHSFMASIKVLQNFLFPANFSFESCLCYLFASFYFIYLKIFLLKNTTHTHTQAPVPSMYSLSVFLKTKYTYVNKYTHIKEQHITSTQKSPHVLFQTLPVPKVKVPTIFLIPDTFIF